MICLYIETMRMFYTLITLSIVMLNTLSTFGITVPNCSEETCGLCNVKVTSHNVIATCTGNNITKVPEDLPANTTKLYLSGTHIKMVGKGAFSIYPSLTELFFRDTTSESCRLEYLEPGVFDMLDNLEALGMVGCGRLTFLEAGVLGTFQNLDTLHIYRSGLTSVPDLSQFRTTNPDMEGVMKEIDFHSNQIEKISSYDFANVRTDTLKLEDNKITHIDSFAFKNATIVNLLVSKNVDLVDIKEEAFAEVALINKLDLSNTRIENLPTKGLSKLRHLILKNTPSMKHFPSVLDFTKIERAELTYPHHCCAFKNPEKQNPTAWRAKQAQERINRQCAITTVPMPTASLDTKRKSKAGQTTMDAKEPDDSQAWNQPLWNQQSGTFHTRLKRSFGDFGKPNIDLNDMNDTDLIDTDGDRSSIFGEGVDGNSFGDFGSPEKDSNHKQNWGPGNGFHRSTVPVDENITQNAFCGEIYVYNRNVTCTPEPDAFNPCEDVMGYVWLRVIVWFVLFAALLGNSLVLIVLITSRGKFTVPKFLMCNLAFADLLMGVYLIFLASIDIHTLGEYFNYAVQWQNEGGCQAAGFLSVFSSELSIFTLTILTLERWYAISHAIHLNKRLKLRHSVGLMGLGYGFAIALGLLPLVGISGYGNVSICLPMKVEDGVDVGYVVSLLIMNGIMFLAICFCYINMYWKVKGSATTARSNDATIAKRMALLVFTNFACWAPIAFFGLTASAGLPLIDITNSKILLVFFYPLNSCANPFLYAILTKQFRKDVFILLGKYGLCVEKANMYRGTYTSRTMSQSRGNKDHVIHGNHRNSESVFSHLPEINHYPTRYNGSSTPKIHPCVRRSPETQPFIERSHLDRAAEFTNRTNTEDVSLDTWTTGSSGDRDQNYVRSISCYTQLNNRKISGPRQQMTNNGRLRTSVETFFSNSTDTTTLSENFNTSEDIWQIREADTIDGYDSDNRIRCDSFKYPTESRDNILKVGNNIRDAHSHENCSIAVREFDDLEVYRKLVQDDLTHNNGNNRCCKRQCKVDSLDTNEEDIQYLVKSPSNSSLGTSSEADVHETNGTCHAVENGDINGGTTVKS